MQTVTVSVNSTKILEKASRLFNNAPQSVLGELFQNARRAGAKKIVSSVADGQVSIAHDGNPITDWSTVFCLGGSGWQGGVVESEDPAGMGMFVLGLFPVSSVHSSGECVRLTAQNWREAGPVTIESDPEGAAHGCSVEYRFSLNDIDDSTRWQLAAERLARHYPLPVFDGVGGTAFSQVPWIEHKPDAETIWGGMRIAAYYRSEIWRSQNKSKIRFCEHEVMLPEELNAPGFVLAEVLSDADVALRLVLPGRHSVVQDKAWAEFKGIAEKLIFEACLTATGGQHRLSYQMFCHGRELGVDLPEAKPVLSSPGEEWNEVDVVQRLEQQVQVLVVENSFDKCQLELLMANKPSDVVLVKATSKYLGYSWYDALPRVCDNVELLCDGENIWDELADNRKSIVDTGEVVYVETLKLVVDGTAWPDPEFIILSNDDYLYGQCLLEDTCGFVVRKGVEQSTLVDNALEMAISLWEPCEDDEADSFETQKQWFEKEALVSLTDLLGSRKEMLALQIAAASKMITGIVSGTLTVEGSEGEIITFQITKGKVEPAA